MEKNFSVEDLANIVAKKLEQYKKATLLPDLKTLHNLFENLFYASIKTEESQSIKVTVTLIDSKLPDPSPPRRVVKDRWKSIAFTEKIPFTVKNIVKLSKAADPWSSSLAVEFNKKGELYIWGLIDQAVHYQSYLHYEADAGPEPPGLFQTTITGLGSLLVMIDYQLIATLKQNTLISNYLDVFAFGPLSDFIKGLAQQSVKKLLLEFEEKFQNENIKTYLSFVDNIWIEVISRILIKTQNFEHGGAVLISDDIDNLTIKHSINYSRLGDSIYNFSKSSIEYNIYSTEAFDIWDVGGLLPTELYLHESVADIDKKESNDELKGAIRFISSLTCIDGLVLLDTELNVKGFGVVIQSINLPEYVYISKTARINEKKLLQVEPNHYGTRHRSMFSHCWKNENAVGFVISQDGDVRAIKKVKDKLIMWENIKIQRLSNSSRLTRRRRK